MDAAGHDVTLRPIEAPDAKRLSDAFAAIGWSKPSALFQRYLQQQATGERWVRVAELDGAVAGYVTLLWVSPDPELRRLGIPEIVDLNVLPAYRRRGIASRMMDAAEAEACGRAARVGIRVGLHSGYGAAQRLYVRRGYVPDGSGAIRAGEAVGEGEAVLLDDDLTLRLTLDLEAE
jgi:GNAT superfamily N-acetyltransferase